MTRRIILFLIIGWFALLKGQASPEVTTAEHSWSLTMSGGVYHPLIYSPTQELLTGMMGVGTKYYFTPAFSLGIEADYLFANRRRLQSRDPRFFAHLNVGLNTLNLFGTSKNKLHRFNIEPTASIGWGHNFTGKGISRDEGGSYFVSKLSIDFYYFLNATRSWGLSLRPAVLYDLRSENESSQIEYSMRRASLLCTIGIVHRWNAKKTLYKEIQPPTPVKPETILVVKRDTIRTIVEPPHTSPTTPILPVQETNRSPKAKEEIALPPSDFWAMQEREMKEKARKKRGRSKRTRNQYEESTFDIDAKTSPSLLETSDSTATSPKDSTAFAEKWPTPTPESDYTIAFAKARSTVVSAQFSTIEKIGRYLTDHPKSKITIRAYIANDNEQNKKRNLGILRAEAIKFILIARYGIDYRSIDARSAGTAGFYKNTNRNRIAICTITNEE